MDEGDDDEEADDEALSDWNIRMVLSLVLV